MLSIMLIALTLGAEPKWEPPAEVVEWSKDRRAAGPRLQAVTLLRQIIANEKPKGTISNVERKRLKDKQVADKAQLDKMVVAIKEAEKQAEERKAHSLSFDNLKVGDVGMFDIYTTLKVVEVVNGNNMLVEWIRATPGQRIRRYGNQSVVVGGPPDISRKMIWIAASTTGMADGSKLETNRKYKVTGTKSYKTVDDGKSTIFLLEPAEDNPPEKKPQ